MINEIVWRRILYIGIGLVAAVVIILAIVVIPQVLADKSPSADTGKSVPAISVLVVVHLLIVVALMGTIKVNNLGGKINKALLVVAGVIPMAASLLIIDGASAYIDKS